MPRPAAAQRTVFTAATSDTADSQPQRRKSRRNSLKYREYSARAIEVRGYWSGTPWRHTRKACRTKEMNGSQELGTTNCLKDSESQEAHLEELTLTSLPDVPLLRVLWHLPATDLSAVGQVDPRLSDLIRRERSVWRGKSADFSDGYGDGDLAALLGLLQDIPPLWTRLSLSVCDPEISVSVGVHISDEEEWTLSVATCSPLGAVEVLKKLGSVTRSLSIHNFTTEMDLILRSLGECKSLEKLELHWHPEFTCNYLHGSGVPYSVPPKLHSIGIDFDGDEYLDEGSCLHSFLKALIDCGGGGSARTLRNVALRSPSAFPLVELCPRDLFRLTVTPPEALMVEMLESALCISELEELEIVETEYYYEAAEDELGELLRAWRSPLKRLKLDYCPEGVVRALGSGALTCLTWLDLGILDADALRALPAALPALPSLDLFSVSTSSPSPAFFFEVSRTDTPALKMIVMFNKSCSYRLDSSPARALDFAIRSLVIGKPMEVVMLQAKCAPACPCKTLFLHYTKSGKHSPDGLELRSCFVCVHAQRMAELETVSNELRVKIKKAAFVD